MVIGAGSVVTNVTVNGGSAVGGAAGAAGGGGAASNGTAGTGSGGGAAVSASPQIANSIYWNNSDTSGMTAAAQINGGTPAVTYTDVKGGLAGTGNLNADPLFVNAGAGNLRIQPGSPARDTGSNAAVPVGVTTDLAGDPRIFNVTVDMGAYEYLAASVSSPTGGGTFCPGAAVLLSVTASGQLPLSYQWRKGMVNVADGATIGGSHTATLSINPAATGDSGSYDCLLTDAGNQSVTSGATTMLTISDGSPPTVTAPVAITTTQTICQ